MTNAPACNQCPTPPGPDFPWQPTPTPLLLTALELSPHWIPLAEMPTHRENFPVLLGLTPHAGQSFYEDALLIPLGFQESGVRRAAALGHCTFPASSIDACSVPPNGSKSQLTREGKGKRNRMSVEVFLLFCKVLSKNMYYFYTFLKGDFLEYFFYFKGPDIKYFQLCRLYSICWSYPTLLLYKESKLS